MFDLLLGRRRQHPDDMTTTVHYRDYLQVDGGGLGARLGRWLVSRAAVRFDARVHIAAISRDRAVARVEARPPRLNLAARLLHFLTRTPVPASR